MFVGQQALHERVRTRLVAAIPYFLLFANLALAGYVRADFDVASLDGPRALGTEMSVLEDPDQQLRIEDVLQRERVLPFRKSHVADPGFGFTDSALWLRLRTRNSGKEAALWVLDFPYPMVDYLTLYAVEGGQVRKVWHAGELTPYAQKPVARPGSAFILQAEPGHTVTYFARAHGAGSLRIAMEAHPLPEFIAHAERRNVLMSMFYGLLSVMFVFNCGVYFFVRQREFLSYAAFIICELSANMALNGHAAAFFFPNAPRLATAVFPISLSLCFVTLAIFTRDLLQRYDRFEDLTRTCNLVLYAASALTLFTLSVSPQLALRVLTDVLVVVALGSPLILRAIAKREDHELWLYNRSWYSVALLLPLHALRYANVLPAYPLFDWAAQIGCAIQAVLTSLALAWRVNLMRARLGELNQQLSCRVTELRAALLEAEAATARAERATKVKDEFIATMSHELRTPLNAVINIPQGLLRDFREIRSAECGACNARFVLDEDETLREPAHCTACNRGLLTAHTRFRFTGKAERAARFLRIIERCGTHLRQMVNGILDISKMEAGRLELIPERTCLRSLLQEAIDEISGAAHVRRIQIRTRMAEGESQATVDGMRVKQVLLNLLSNAVKFSPDDGRIDVHWLRDSRGDTISVKDRGIGIASENQTRIFSRFEQVHVGDTRKYGGTGLGLSISRSLVRMHGGELWVESSLGQGSTFSFHLPNAPSMPSQSAQSGLSTLPAERVSARATTP